MEQDRRNELKRLMIKQEKLEQRLLENKDTGSILQHQLDRLDQAISEILGGGPLEPVRIPLTELDDFILEEFEPCMFEKQ